MKVRNVTIRSAVVCALLGISNASFADEAPAAADATNMAATAPAQGTYTDNYLPSKERFRFSGFGSLGLMYLDNSQLSYTPLLLQDGPGVRDKIDYAYGSILGLQGSFKINPEWSFTTQVTFKRDLKKFEPNLEWMFIKYQPNESWAFRVGRMSAPLLGLSDTRLVNYSHLWVRPPVVLYQAPFTTFDGADATYRTGLGDGNLKINGFYSAKIEVKTDVTTQPPIDVRDGFGLNVEYEIGALNVRAASIYSGTANWHGVDPFTLPDTRLGGASVYQALTLNGFNSVVNDLGINGKTSLYTNLGASYEYNNWLLSAEVSSYNVSGNRLFPDTLDWYASLGYRYQQFTPYVSYAHSEVKSDTTNPLAGTPLAAIGAPVYNNNGSETFGAGVRWDFRQNMALKLQVEHIKRDGPFNSGYGQTTARPGVTNVPSSVNLFSTSLDFVF
jgi:hypothetical protein